MVRVGPMTAGFRIGERGSLENAPLAGATPDLVLSLSPLDVPRSSPIRGDGTNS